MVRLSLVEPLVRELENRRIDLSESLAALSVRREELLDQSIFVPASKMYAVVEKLAEASGDPHFGVHVGEKLDPWLWPPMLEAARNSSTVGEFLLRFMEGAQQNESSATYVLKTIEGRTTFYERRFTDGGLTPRHNDGFTIAYLLTIVRQALGGEWEGTKVLASCCDPDVIPTGYLGIRIATTDTLGASISFPASWLLKPVSIQRSKQTTAYLSMESIPATTIVEAFRQAILPYLHELELDMDRVAAICGFSKRTLSRRLQANGTTAQRELAELRRAQAEKALMNTSLSVAAIAARVGYSDPAVFSRAFKRWTGLSPREFRQSRKKQSTGQQ